MRLHWDSMARTLLIAVFILMIVVLFGGLKDILWASNLDCAAQVHELAAANRLGWLAAGHDVELKACATRTTTFTADTEDKELAEQVGKDFNWCYKNFMTQEEPLLNKQGVFCSVCALYNTETPGDKTAIASELHKRMKAYASDEEAELFIRAMTGEQLIDIEQIKTNWTANMGIMYIQIRGDQEFTERALRNFIIPYTGGVAGAGLVAGTATTALIGLGLLSPPGWVAVAVITATSAGGAAIGTVTGYVASRFIPEHPELTNEIILIPMTREQAGRLGCTVIG